MCITYYITYCKVNWITGEKIKILKSSFVFIPCNDRGKSCGSCMFC